LNVLGQNCETLSSTTQEQRQEEPFFVSASDAFGKLVWPTSAV
jgi:hypothetical protein